MENSTSQVNADNKFPHNRSMGVSAVFFLKLVILLMLFNILVACNGSSSSEGFEHDKYLGKWNSFCEEGESGELYFIYEYVFSEFLIVVNSHAFEDASCQVPLESAPSIHVADIEYHDYEVITTRSGYKARWYDAYIQPGDESLELIDYDVGFYLEGDTLYKVFKPVNYNGYVIDFDVPYSRI